MHCVSSCSETILRLVKDKTILLLSPCMAYSGKSNGDRINIVSVLASSWAWSYSVNSLFCRPGAIVLQRSVWDVYRSDFRVRRSSQRLDWDLWDRGRRWRNRGWVEVPRSECVRVIWSSLEVTEFITMFFLIRRRLVRTDVQEQSLQTDLRGLPGNGRPLRRLLPDLPQHPERRPRRLWHQHPKESVSNSEVTIQQRKGEWTRGRLVTIPFCFNEISVVSLSVSIALLCSFLLGLGDSCFNTQLYSILGHVYAEQSTPAFAIFKFIQVIPSCQFSDVVSGAEQSWVKMLSSQVWNKFTWSPIKMEKNKSHIRCLISHFVLRPNWSLRRNKP